MIVKLTFIIVLLARNAVSYEISFDEIELNPPIKYYQSKTELPQLWPWNTENKTDMSKDIKISVSEDPNDSNLNNLAETTTENNSTSDNTTVKVMENSTNITDFNSSNIEFLETLPTKGINNQYKNEQHIYNSKPINKTFSIPSDLETYLPKSIILINKSFKNENTSDEKSEEDVVEKVQRSEKLRSRSNSTYTGMKDIKNYIESTTNINFQKHPINSAEMNDILKNKKKDEIMRKVTQNSRFLNEDPAFEKDTIFSPELGPESYHILGLLKNTIPRRDRRLSGKVKRMFDTDKKGKENFKDSHHNVLKSKAHKTLLGPLSALHDVAVDQTNNVINNVIKTTENNQIEVEDKINNITNKFTGNLDLTSSTEKSPELSSYVNHSLMIQNQMHYLTKNNENTTVNLETANNTAKSENTILKGTLLNDSSVRDDFITTQSSNIPVTSDIAVNTVSPNIPSAFYDLENLFTTTTNFYPLTEYFTEIPGILPTISSVDYKNHRNSRKLSKLIDFTKTNFNYTKEQYEAIKAVNLDKIVEIIMSNKAKTDQESFSDSLKWADNVKRENNPSNLNTSMEKDKSTFGPIDYNETKSESITEPTSSEATLQNEKRSLTNDDYKMELIKNIIRETLRSKLRFYEQNDSDGPVDESLDSPVNENDQTSTDTRRRKRSTNEIETDHMSLSHLDSNSIHSIDTSSKEGSLLEFDHIKSDVDVGERERKSYDDKSENIEANIKAQNRNGTMFNYFVDLLRVIKALTSKCASNETADPEQHSMQCVRRVILKTLERAVDSDEITIGFNLALVKKNG